MKKIMLTSALILTAVSVTAMTQNVEAAPSTKEVKTTFSLGENPDPDGSLIIEDASQLEFAGADITANETTAKLKKDTVSLIKINEFSGKMPGWSLQAKATVMKSGEKGLDGASIDFKTPVFNPGAGNTIDPAKKPVVGSSTVAVTGGASVQIAKALAGNGYGRWEITNKDVELNVPAGNIAGNYEGKMIYTLTSGPTAVIVP